MRKEASGLEQEVREELGKGLRGGDLGQDLASALSEMGLRRVLRRLQGLTCV